MSFTPPTDESWQTLLDELTNAYSERRQALYNSPYTPVDDRDVQAASYWAGMQNWINNSCCAFIDHVAGPLNPAEDDFLYFTTSAFRSAAGLNSDGFRRSVDGVNFLYGVMQEGDIIGDWIFEDLQKAFGALKWTIDTASGLGTNGSRYSWIGFSENNCQEAYDNNIADSAYVYSREYNYYTLAQYGKGRYSDHSGGWEPWKYYYRSYRQITDYVHSREKFVDASVDFYAWASGSEDLDGVGSAYLFSQHSSTSDTEVTSAVLGEEFTNNPLTASSHLPRPSSPTDCPPATDCEYGVEGYDEWCQGPEWEADVQVNAVKVLLKWDFTY